MTLATGTNTIASWADCTKTTRQWTLIGSGLQLAKQLDSREDIVWVIVVEVVDSAFGFLPSQVLQKGGRANQVSWPVDYLGHVPQTG